MVEITKNMKFSEVMLNHPDSILIFLEHGLTCVGCPFAAQETIEQGAKSHGIDVDALVNDLNKRINKKENE